MMPLLNVLYYYYYNTHIHFYQPGMLQFNI